MNQGFIMPALRALSRLGLLATLLLLPRLSLAQEAKCDDGLDDDGDGMVDCADAECAKLPACKPDGNPEDTNERCSDWVDNDEDGEMDCDDDDCGASHVTVCQGSWDSRKARAAAAKAQNQGNVSQAPTQALPTLGEGMTVQDLIGKGGDIDGERNDMDCADGIDNDGDGMVDCADFGCRFDESVTVCQGNPNMRFSVVGMLTQEYDIEEEVHDSRFSRLQLRTFGPIPRITNSFYLISMLVERTPRVTFAMFQIPLGKKGHFLGVNSGAAGLSQANAISIHKQLLIDRPNLSGPMEQFNSAAVELTGPITSDSKLKYRLFAAGGNGRFDGNIGGRTVSGGNQNYPWGGGAQLHMNLIGFYSRFDTPFLYTPVPLTLGILAGAKYDEREEERFYSGNLHVALRYSRFITMFEGYTKRELEFKSWQHSYHIQAGFLLWPEHLMIAADWGEFLGGEMENEPAVLTSTLKRQRDTMQYRAGIHWYFFRYIGVASIVYRNQLIREGFGRDEQRTHDVKGVIRYFF
ncbi:hypothetical protein KKF91_14440 [Myxococcota bacterium]|nr:hypothetical protein [Myxococcota bacterium]